MSMDISLIVPLYKGQKYINKILEMTANNQEHLQAKAELELIFVNDFPEEEIVLPEGAAKSGGFVRVIENQANAGIHQSRIYGLKSALGKWVVFLDQDDTIADTYLASQLAKAEGFDAVVSNGYWRNWECIYSETYPFVLPCSFETFLEGGYPLVSLGQLMVRREKIPDAWTKTPLEHNGCDDLYLWALMMAEHAGVAANGDLIYTHEEDGKNASLNYREMQRSIENVKENFLALNCVSRENNLRFADMLDRIASKYKQYDALHTVFGSTAPGRVEQYLLSRGIQTLAVYGIGIYGKALLELLEHTCIRVCYGIDQRADVKDVGIPVVSIDSEMESVDAVIVTPIAEFDKIRETLREKGVKAGQMICLDEILS